MVRIVDMDDEEVRAAVPYWTTAAGFSRLVEERDAARAAVDALRAEGGATFSRWYDTSQRKQADRLDSFVRTVEKIRTEDAVAESRWGDYSGGRLPTDVETFVDAEHRLRPQSQSVQDSNGNWHTSTVIGSVRVDRPFTATRTFETAAWSETMQVQPGVYPIRPDQDHMVQVGYDATVTDQNFPPLLGGVPVGPSRKDGVGQSTRHHVSAYEFTLPGAYGPGGEGFGGAVALRDGVSLTRNIVVSDRGMSALTRVELPDDVEQLPNVPNEFRSRLYRH